MDKVNSKLIIQVLDGSGSGIGDAEVFVRSKTQEFELNYTGKKGVYIVSQEIPFGHYQITVSRKPLQTETRRVLVKHEKHDELFVLIKEDADFYYRGKVKMPFSPIKDKFAMVIPENSCMTKKSKTRKALKVTEREQIAQRLAKKHRLSVEVPHENFLKSGIFLCSFSSKTNQRTKKSVIESLEKEAENTALPILKLTDNHVTLLTNEIMAKFDDYTDESEVKKLAGELDLKIKRKISALGNFYHFTTGKAADYDILKTINKIADREDVEFAEPNLASTVEDDTVIPTDFLFPEQWDHALINTTDAWQFLRNINNNRTFGSPNVVIGVVDSGVDGNHPDFNGNVSDGSSKIMQSFDFVNMAANNNNLTSDHGTCCASAAASMTNNTSGVPGINEGVAGVAGNCRVLAIRRVWPGTEAGYADMYLWAAGFDPESDDDAFPAQLSKGADVITNSINHPGSGSAISGTMQTVFDKLTDEGRDGKGTLLFFSAGNNFRDNDTNFDRPWGMYNRCFSIAASTLANDGVTEVQAPYSNFSQTIEICAPSSDNGGVRLHNPTGSYGTLTATIRQTNPLQTLALNNNTNAGNSNLTLNAVLNVGSGVMTINDGTNTESHLFNTNTDAVGNRTNQITLFSNLQNSFNAGANIQVYAGYTPGSGVAVDQLNGNVTAGANTITLDSAAGFAVGQSILIENPGNANSESNTILAINGNQLTLGAALFNNHADNAPVSGSTGDYRNYFGGTSHATPLCAGAAALMLSANPQLTWTDVRQILRDTAVKINPTENAAAGRWQDVNGNASNTAAYNGTPFFSEFYGFGRLNAAAAVREAGWDIDLITPALDFNDVPEGDTVSRAIRFDVKSLWPTNFNITAAPGNPFTPFNTSVSLAASSDSTVTREAYLWITYTGTSDGDEITMADGVTVTVSNPETEQEWVIPITANVINRPSSAIMLCLDKSGSMGFDSGIGNSKRIDLLRFSANIMIDVLHENNGLGIVAFDHNPHDVLSLVGPVGPPPSPSNPIDPDRTSMKSAINNFDYNPNGSTAIGDGIERALNKLNPVNDYDSKSIIVFTDGQETDEKYIADVADQINDRMFAVGLGKAENINPAALNAVANNNDGYMLLADGLGQDSIFKLAKYFLQIQASVNNEDIVVDPDGVVYPGQVHKTPFVLNEADLTVDVITMLPQPGAVEFYIETPNGDKITPADSGSTPGVLYSFGNNVLYYRLNLPLPLTVQEKEGTWNAVLVTKGYNTVKMHDRHAKKAEHSYSGNIEGKGGVPYSLLVHSYSNLNMSTNVSQTHYEAGAIVNIDVDLDQFGIPLETKCSVIAKVISPLKKERTIELNNLGNGSYHADFVTEAAGTYQLRVMASGESLRGRKFTREQVRTVSVWHNGNQPFPQSGDDESCGTNICDVLKCLLGNGNISKEFKDKLKKQGINLDGIIKCLGQACGDKKPSAELLDKLKVDYSKLLKTYESILKQ